MSDSSDTTLPTLRTFAADAQAAQDAAAKKETTKDIKLSGGDGLTPIPSAKPKSVRDLKQAPLHSELENAVNPPFSNVQATQSPELSITKNKDGQQTETDIPVAPAAAAATETAPHEQPTEPATPPTASHAAPPHDTSSDSTQPDNTSLGEIDTNATVITDTKHTRHGILSSIGTAVKEWVGEKQAEFTTAEEPTHTVESADARKDVISSAARESAAPPRDDTREFRERMQSVERTTDVAPVRVKPKESVAEPSWSHFTTDEHTLSDDDTSSRTAPSGQDAHDNRPTRPTAAATSGADTAHDATPSPEPAAEPAVEHAATPRAPWHTTPDTASEPVATTETPARETDRRRTPNTPPEQPAASESSGISHTTRQPEPTVAPTTATTTSSSEAVPDAPAKQATQTVSQEPTDTPKNAPASTTTPETATPRTAPASHPLEDETPPPSDKAPGTTPPPVSAATPEPTAGAQSATPTTRHTTTNQPTTSPAPVSAPERSARSRTPFGVALTVVIFLAIGLGTGTAVWWFGTGSSPAQVRDTAVPDHFDRTRAVPLSFSIARDQLLATLDAAPTTEGSSIQYYFVETVQDEERVVSTRTLLDSLEFRNANRLTRSTTELSLGSIGSEPFLLFRVNDVESAFLGVLEWEDTMSADLAPWFGTPVRQTKEPTSRAIDQLEPAFFADEVVANVDARILRDATGTNRIVHTFLDGRFLLITTKPTVIPQVRSILR